MVELVVVLVIVKLVVVVLVIVKLVVVVMVEYVE